MSQLGVFAWPSPPWLISGSVTTRRHRASENVTPYVTGKVLRVPVQQSSA